ncbi:MAG: hypothetical protein H6Q60_425 [Oscillospiraceae bacterium]|nr:hypothetical protein [Oscillospiraceae bacterium]
MTKGASDELFDLLQNGEIELNHKQKADLMDQLKCYIPAMKSIESPTGDLEVKSPIEFMEHIDARLDRIEKLNAVTNEQRAHDLAIVMLQVQLTPEAMQARAQEEINSGATECVVNIEEMYFEAYETALIAINKKYPQST